MNKQIKLDDTVKVILTDYGLQRHKAMKGTLPIIDKEKYTEYSLAELFYIFGYSNYSVNEFLEDRPFDFIEVAL